MSFWHDRSTYFLVRINSIIRLVSFGSFSIHVLFFTFFSFIGLVGLYHFFKPYFKDNIIWLTLILFLVPSEIFWYSGLHKESPIIFSIGMIFYSFKRIFMDKESKLIYSLILILSLIILIFSRGYVFVALIASGIPFVISMNRKQHTLKIYATSFFIFILIGLSVIQFNNRVNIFQELQIRQEHFFNSPGNTSFPIPPIKDNMISIIKNIPNALINIAIRPLPTDCAKSNIWCFLAMIEAYFFFALVLFSLSKLRWKELQHKNIVLFCFSFTLFVSIIIGLIVNNAGALIRYKSISLPFLLIALYFIANKEKKAVI